jgi:hypothetical protein
MFFIEIESLFPTRPNGVGEWCFFEFFYHFCARALEMIHAKRDDTTRMRPTSNDFFLVSGGDVFENTEEI